MTGKEIATIVAEEFNLTFPEMTRTTQEWRISRPRQAAMFVVRRLRPKMSYPMIGRLFGGRDHTTVLHGVRAVQRRIEQDPQYRAKIGRAFDRVAKRMETAA